MAVYSTGVANGTYLGSARFNFSQPADIIISSVYFTFSAPGGSTWIDTWGDNPTTIAVIGSSSTKAIISSVPSQWGLSSGSSGTFVVTIRGKALYGITLNVEYESAASVSTISPISSVEIGAQFTVEISNARMGSVTNKAVVSLGTWQSGQIDETNKDTSTGKSYFSTLISQEVGNAQLPSSDTGVATLTCYTYNSSGVQVGMSSAQFNVYIPATVKPSLANVAISQTPTDQYEGLALQNYSKLTVTVGSCSANPPIQSYVIVTDDGATYLAGNWNGASALSLYTEKLAKSGTVNVTVTVYDTRGHSDSKTVSYSGIMPYSPPRITSYQVFRASSPDGGVTYIENPSGNKCGVRVWYTFDKLMSGGVAKNQYDLYAHINIGGAWKQIFSYSNQSAQMNEEVIYLDGETIPTNIGVVEAIYTGENSDLDPSTTYEVQMFIRDQIGWTAQDWDMAVSAQVLTAYVFMRWDKTKRAIGFGTYVPDGVQNAVYLDSQWGLYTHGMEIVDLIKDVINNPGNY